MNRLINLGFQRVGSWKLVDEDLQLNLDSHQSSTELIYCFIVGVEPRYFGVTQKTLQNRMSQYRNPGRSQTTNIRIKQDLITALNQDQLIDIFVFIDDRLLSYGGFRINLALGLEPTLIEQYHNLWNIRGNRNAIIAEVLDQLVEENNTDIELNVENSVEIPLSIIAAARQQGFVNIPAAFKDYFGNNGDPINVKFNNTDVLGKIYRDSRTNSVRIYVGIELRNWLTNNFTDGQIINSSLLENRLVL